MLYCIFLFVMYFTQTTIDFNCILNVFSLQNQCVILKGELSCENFWQSAWW